MTWLLLLYKPEYFVSNMQLSKKKLTQWDKNRFILRPSIVHYWEILWAKWHMVKNYKHESHVFTQTKFFMNGWWYCYILEICGCLIEGSVYQSLLQNIEYWKYKHNAVFCDQKYLEFELHYTWEKSPYYNSKRKGRNHWGKAVYILMEPKTYNWH